MQTHTPTSIPKFANIEDAIKNSYPTTRTWTCMDMVHKQFSEYLVKYV